MLDADGLIADCCKGGDDYDVCMPCFGNGVSCQCEDRQMVIMQKSVAGDVVVSEKGETCRRLATAPDVKCTACLSEVTQGRYYCRFSSSPFYQPAGLADGPPDCDSCNGSKDGYDLCENCYGSGHKTCENPDEHRLYVYLRANVPNNVGPYAFVTSESVPCTTCEKQVLQGPYYRKSSFSMPPRNI